MKEKWKPIPEWEYYEVSSLGRVRRAHDHFLIKVFIGGGRIKDRPTVALKQGRLPNGKKRTLRTYVSRLMLLAFVGPPPTAKHEACHIDDVKDNNILDNLKWGTHKQNMKDFIKNGLSRKGVLHHNCRLTPKDIRIIRNTYKPYEPGFTTLDLAIRFKVSKQQIRQIVAGSRWKHITPRRAICYE